MSSTSNAHGSDAHLFQHAIMTRDEQDGLLAQYRAAADEHGPASKRAIALRNRIAVANLRLVAMIAQHYRAPRGMSQEDLHALGFEGLIHGIEKFRPELGYALSTYVSWWIRHAIGREIQNNGGLVRVPVHVSDALSREARGIEGHRPKESLLEDAAAARRVFSLDSPVSDEGGARPWVEMTEGAWTDPSQTIEAEQTAREVRAALDTLPEKLRAIVDARMDGKTLKEIGDGIDRSRERIRQQQQEAFAMLATALADHAPESRGAPEQAVTVDPNELAALPERSRLVLEMLASGASGAEVGRALGVTRSRIWQIEREARGALSKPSASHARAGLPS